MAINPLVEQLITLNEAAALCPRRRRGKKPHLSTLYRWATNGSRGRILETVQTPSGIATSKEAVCRFFDALPRSRPVPVNKPLSNVDHKRQEEAAKELNKRFNIGE